MSDHTPPAQDITKEENQKKARTEMEMRRPNKPLGRLQTAATGASAGSEGHLCVRLEVCVYVRGAILNKAEEIAGRNAVNMWFAPAPCNGAMSDRSHREGRVAEVLAVPALARARIHAASPASW